MLARHPVLHRYALITTPPYALHRLCLTPTVSVDAVWSGKLFVGAVMGYAYAYGGFAQMVAGVLEVSCRHVWLGNTAVEECGILLNAVLSKARSGFSTPILSVECCFKVFGSACPGCKLCMHLAHSTQPCMFDQN